MPSAQTYLTILAAVLWAVIVAVAVLGGVIIGRWDLERDLETSQLVGFTQFYTRTTLQPGEFFLTPEDTTLARYWSNRTEFQYGPSELDYIEIGYSGQRVEMRTPPEGGRCCGSMYPTIGNYSGLLLITPREDQVTVGDMIVFQCKNDSYLLHRVIQITEDQTGKYYLTQGDNNNVDDYTGFGCIPQFSNITSKVVGVLY